MPKNDMTSISDFNKENPFIYMLVSANNSLNEEITEATKNSVILTISTSISIISTIINPNYYSLILSGLIISLYVFAIAQLKVGIKSTKTYEVEKLVHSGEYTYRFVNTEEILSEINSLKISLGKIRFAKETMLIFNVFYSIIILINIIKALVVIFS